MSTIHEQLARLSAEAHAYRARAVRLDARLRGLQRRGVDVAGMREHLHASAANVDAAVATLCAVVGKVA